MELQPVDFSLHAKDQRNVVAAVVSTAEGGSPRQRYGGSASPKTIRFRKSYGVASGSVQDDHGRDCSVYGYVRRMKFFLTFSLACVVAALAETVTNETAAVLQAERDGCVAYLRGDADKIAKFLTDDYALTNSKGE